MNPINPEQGHEADDSGRERLAYQGLLDAVASVEGLIVDTPQRHSLAWLVEQYKQEAPESWEERVDQLRQEILAHNRSGGVFAVSHALAEQIDQRYLAFLDEEMKRADELTSKKLEAIRFMKARSRSFGQRGKEKGEPTSFGGVSKEYLPDWYYQPPE